MSTLLLIAFIATLWFLVDPHATERVKGLLPRKQKPKQRSLRDQYKTRR